MFGRLHELHCRISPSRVIKIQQFLPGHVGINRGRRVTTDLLNRNHLRLKDGPIHAPNKFVPMPVKPRPSQNSGASIDISKLIHRPANTLFLDNLGKIATDRGRTNPCGATCWMSRKIMDRIRTEARGNLFRIGFVACLDIRSDNVFHVLSKRGLRHSALSVVHNARWYKRQLYSHESGRLMASHQALRLVANIRSSIHQIMHYAHLALQHPYSSGHKMGEGRAARGHRVGRRNRAGESARRTQRRLPYP
jgi:hypothetical protein